MEAPTEQEKFLHRQAEHEANNMLRDNYEGGLIALTAVVREKLETFSFTNYQRFSDAVQVGVAKAYGARPPRPWKDVVMDKTREIVARKDYRIISDAVLVSDVLHELRFNTRSDRDKVDIAFQAAAVVLDEEEQKPMFGSVMPWSEDEAEAVKAKLVLKDKDEGNPALGGADTAGEAEGDPHDPSNMPVSEWREFDGRMEVRCYPRSCFILWGGYVVADMHYVPNSGKTPLWRSSLGGEEKDDWQIVRAHILDYARGIAEKKVAKTTEEPQPCEKLKQAVQKIDFQLERAKRNLRTASGLMESQLEEAKRNLRAASGLLGAMRDSVTVKPIYRADGSCAGFEKA